jgi:hypothetical protein
VSWERRDRSGVVEWERDDGNATIRRRERPDGRYVVRVDRLEQAPEGPAYRRETVADADAADDLVASFRAEFDLDEK